MGNRQALLSFVLLVACQGGRHAMLCISWEGAGAHYGMLWTLWEGEVTQPPVRENPLQVQGSGETSFEGECDGVSFLFLLGGGSSCDGL